MNYEVNLYKKPEEGTLRIICNEKNTSCLLWISGYNDYFFHYHISDVLLQNNCDVYALSLKNYNFNVAGDDTTNDIIKNKNLFFCDNFNDYFDNIDKAIEVINKQKCYNKKYIYGHSLGGLIAISYLHKTHDNVQNLQFNGLILNSPFFDFRLSFTFKCILYILSYILHPAYILRKTSLNSLNLLKEYLKNNYDIDQNRIIIGTAPIYAGLLRQMFKYQREIQKNKIQLSLPILVFMSDRECEETRDMTRFPLNKKISELSGDDSLSIADIEKYIMNLSYDVHRIKVKNSIHDILAYKNAHGYVINKLLDFIRD